MSIFSAHAASAANPPPPVRHHEPHQPHRQHPLHSQVEAVKHLLELRIAVPRCAQPHPHIRQHVAPRPRPHKRIDVEARLVHLGHARRKRDKRAYDRQHPPHQHGDRPVARKETVHPVQVAPAQQHPSPIAFHHRPPAPRPRPVRRHRPQVRRQRRHRRQQHQLHLHLHRRHPQRLHQRHARQRHDHLARNRDARRLHRHQQHHAGVPARPAANQPHQQSNNFLRHADAVYPPGISPLPLSLCLSFRSAFCLSIRSALCLSFRSEAEESAFALVLAVAPQPATKNQQPATSPHAGGRSIRSKTCAI